MSTEGITVRNGEFFGDPLVNIEFQCGEKIEFSVKDVPENRVQWIAGSVQRQVDNIIRRERAAAVEQYKAELRDKLAPSVLS